MWATAFSCFTNVVSSRVHCNECVTPDSEEAGHSLCVFVSTCSHGSLRICPSAEEVLSELVSSFYLTPISVWNYPQGVQEEAACWGYGPISGLPWGEYLSRLDLRFSRRITLGAWLWSCCEWGMAWASTSKVILGCIAFAIWWLFAVFPAVPFLPIGRTAGSILGATLMVVFRVITPNHAFAAVDQSSCVEFFNIYSQLSLKTYYQLTQVYKTHAFYKIFFQKWTTFLQMALKIFVVNLPKLFL